MNIGIFIYIYLLPISMGWPWILVVLREGWKEVGEEARGRTLLSRQEMVRGRCGRGGWGARAGGPAAVPVLITAVAIALS